MIRYEILLEKEPVQHIQHMHVARDVAKFGDASREACGRAQDSVYIIATAQLGGQHIVSCSNLVGLQ